MKQKNSDILNLLQKFQQRIENQPTIEKMFEDVRMMSFKIRPLQGDVTLLNLKNEGFIEVLWKLGKLDEFFQKEFHKLKPNEKKVFFRFFDELHQKFQNQLNNIHLKIDKLSYTQPFFELEIFKEKRTPQKAN